MPEPTRHTCIEIFDMHPTCPQKLDCAPLFAAIATISLQDILADAAAIVGYDGDMPPSTIVTEVNM